MRNEESVQKMNWRDVYDFIKTYDFQSWWLLINLYFAKKMSNRINQVWFYDQVFLTLQKIQKSNKIFGKQLNLWLNDIYFLAKLVVYLCGD